MQRDIAIISAYIIYMDAKKLLSTYLGITKPHLQSKSIIYSAKEYGPRLIVNKYYDIFEGNVAPDISLPRGNKRFELYLMNKRDISHEDLSNLQSLVKKYHKTYGNTMNLTAITDLDNRTRYGYGFSDKRGEPIGYIEQDNPRKRVDKLKKMAQFRREGLSQCSNMRPGDQFYTKRLDTELLSPANLSGDICQSIDWGDMHKPVTTNCSDPEFMLETIKPSGTRQYVFGPRYEILKYQQCSKHFIVMPMKEPPSGENSCHPLVEWTPLLNFFYTICSEYGQSDFIRFVIPRSSFVRPEKKTKATDVNEIYRGQPLAILRIPFLDDRPGWKGDPNRTLELLIFKRPGGDKYKYWEHHEYSPFNIYDLFGNNISPGLLFKSKYVTYTEFNYLACYLGLNIYSNKKYPHIYFFSRQDHSPEKLAMIGLNKIELNCEVDNRGLRHVIRFTSNKDEIINLGEGHYIYTIPDGRFLVSFEYPLAIEIVQKYGAKQYMSQTGGGGTDSKNDDIRLKWTDDFKLYDREIGTPFFSNFYQLTNRYWGMFEYDYRLAAKFTLNIYPHELISPADFVAYTHREVHERGGRKININFLLDQKIDKFSLVKYIPFTPRFFHAWEILKSFDKLLPIGGRKMLDVLEVSNNPSFLEAVYYYERKYRDVVSNYNLDYYTAYNYLERENYTAKMEYLKYYSQHIKMKLNVVNGFINPHNINKRPDSKYDLIVSNLGVNHRGIPLSENLNNPIVLANVCSILPRLKDGGNLVLIVEKVTTKPMADLIVICSSFFQRYELYRNEIQNPYKISSTAIVFLDFKNRLGERFDRLVELSEQYYDFDPTGLNLNVIDKKEREKYLITREVVPGVKYKYIDSLLDIKSDDSRYDPIRRYNEQLYFNQVIFMRKLIQLKESGADRQKELLEQYRKGQIVESTLWARKYDLEHLDFEERSLNNQFGQLIVEDMYSYHEDIRFDIKTEAGNYYGKDQLDEEYKGVKADIVPLMPQFAMMRRALFLTDYLIDTRDITRWNKVKKVTRYYRPENRQLSLVNTVEKQYLPGGLKISQAWLKMYEIITLFNLIPRTGKKFTTFHACEAPGNFISAINHFVKTKTDVHEFDWMAQSLNPYKHKGAERTAFGDSYGYMRRHPDRWNWGADGTGDITNPDNIRYYGKFTHGRQVDLMTSDCGIPWSEESATSGVFQKLFFSQILFMLQNLPKGGSFVAKMFLPVSLPTEINLFFLVWKSFRKMSLYKSVINPYSKEFYLICQDYQGVEKRYLDAMLKNLERGDRFDKDFDLFNREYPEDFQYQLSRGLRMLVDKYTYTIERQLYYVDNIDKIESKHLKQLQKAIIEKNNEWLRKFRLRRIDRDELL